MSALNQAFLFSTALLTVTSLAAGFFSIGRNPKSKTVWLWFLMNMAIAAWGALLYQVVISGERNNPEAAFFYLKITVSLVPFIPIFFLHFVLAFLRKNVSFRWVLDMGYV